MTEKKFIGIFLYNPANGKNEGIDFESVSAYAVKLENVSVVWQHGDIGIAYVDPLFTAIENVGLFAKKINERQLKRIVIAGDTPGMVKDFFTKAMVMSGNNPNDIVLASFRENGAVSKSDTERAKSIVACAVRGIPFEKVAISDELSLNPETLVIGGGIAGITASLQIAAAGQKVYLVEKSETIGGNMAKLDETFPALDCAPCNLIPKMIDVEQNENIVLMTCSEVKSISGVPGNYKVKILKKARFVDLSTCISCGICSEKCPVEVPSEFNLKTSLRKAIYIPFPQAVPNKYVIDKGSCTYFKSKACDICSKVCPVSNCINYQEKDEEIEINVGNIIFATGYKTFDAERVKRLGYGQFPNVVTSMEFERLISPTGPTAGNITFRTKDSNGNMIFKKGSPAPSSFAILHCVGSRDENFHKYCSKVCCMNSLKFAHLIRQKFPKSEIFEYFIDIRAYGKGHEEFHKRVKTEDAHVIRGRTAKITQKDGKLHLMSEDVINRKLIEQDVDMVILAIGMEPRVEAAEIAGMLGVKQTEDGWLMENNYVSNSTGTYTGGVSIAGVCQGPKDIPDTIAHASAAAAGVLQSIERGKLSNSIKDLTLSQIESNISKLSIIKE